MKKIYVLFLMTFFIVGCGGFSLPEWRHPTANKRQFNIDSAKCHAYAVRQVPMPQFPLLPTSADLFILLEYDRTKKEITSEVSQSRNNVFSGCMAEEGYTYEWVEQ